MSTLAAAKPASDVTMHGADDRIDRADRPTGSGGEPIRALLVHNYYQQSGGEDMVFADEAALLTARGHAVQQLIFDNDDIAPERSPLDFVRLAGATIWSQRGYTDVRDAIRTFRPDVVHFHNTFPLISPAAYYAARAEGVPVVQTLHNFRLLCANGLFYRGGHVCEDCLGKAVPLPGLVHACYRESRAATAATVTMLTAHRALHTWTHMVDRYIVLTDFARQKFIQGGLPAEKMVIKPNFVSDPAVGDGGGRYALFVGRLSQQKGVRTLLRAWERLPRQIPLKIAGDGSLATDVADVLRRLPQVEWLGHLSPDAVTAAMRDAALLVFPSESYEGLPRTILESFAVGTPVIASDLGAMHDLIREDDTGFHFRAGDPDDLARVIEAAFARPDALGRMRARARAEFQAHYTADENYHQLMDIYAQARNARLGTRATASHPRSR